MIITLVFEKNANFFAENCRKSQKIVIITSVHGINVVISILSDLRQFSAKKWRFLENQWHGLLPVHINSCLQRGSVLFCNLM
jgi:hypothetical protein